MPGFKAGKIAGNLIVTISGDNVPCVVQVYRNGIGLIGTNLQAYSSNPATNLTMHHVSVGQVKIVVTPQAGSYRTTETYADIQDNKDTIINIPLVAALGSLSATVNTPGGGYVSLGFGGVGWGVFNTNGSQVANGTLTGISDTVRSFSSDLPPGDYTLSLAAAGFQSLSQGFTVHAGQTTNLTLNMVPTYGTLTVSASMPSSNAPSSFQWRVADSGSNTVQSGSLNQNSGGYSTQNLVLPTGSYTLYATGTGQQDFSQTFLVTGGQTVGVNINTSSAESGVAFTVNVGTNIQNNDGAGTQTYVTGLTAQGYTGVRWHILNGSNNDILDGAFTDTTLFTFNSRVKLDPGNYTLVITAFGYSSQRLPFTVNAGRYTNLVASMQPYGNNWKLVVQFYANYIDSNNNLGAIITSSNIYIDNNNPISIQSYSSPTGGAVSSGHPNILWKDLQIPVGSNLSINAVSLTSNQSTPISLSDPANASQFVINWANGYVVGRGQKDDGGSDRANSGIIVYTAPIYKNGADLSQVLANQTFNSHPNLINMTKSINSPIASLYSDAPTNIRPATQSELNIASSNLGMALLSVGTGQYYPQPILMFDGIEIPGLKNHYFWVTQGYYAFNDSSYTGRTINFTLAFSGYICPNTGPEVLPSNTTDPNKLGTLIY